MSALKFARQLKDHSAGRSVAQPGGALSAGGRSRRFEAYHRVAVEGIDKARLNFAHWQMRCELIAPRGARDAIQDVIDTNDRPEARLIAHEKLQQVLRKDLGIEEN